MKFRYYRSRGARKGCLGQPNIDQAYSPVEICLVPVPGPSAQAGIDLAFGPKGESSVFLSAEGEANISLGRSPRKMEQNFGQG